MFAFIKNLFGGSSKTNKHKILFSVERTISVPARIDQPFKVLFTSPYSQNKHFDHFLVGVTRDRRIFAAFGNNGCYQYLLVSKEEVRFATLAASDIVVQQVGEHMAIYVFGKLAAKGTKASLKLGHHELTTTMDVTDRKQRLVFGAPMLIAKRRIQGLPVHLFGDTSSV